MREFAKMRGEYREPALVLFSGAVDSGCGFAKSAMGPFYCSADERVFIDLTFFDELRRSSAPAAISRAPT